MIQGIGIDITEITRIQKAQERHKNFAAKILTAAEFEYFEKMSNRRKNEYLAGRFSAKESYSKAYGTGIGKQVSFQEVEILNDEKSGRPIITKQPLKNGKAHISISHTDKLVMTEVIIESN
ncbi:holo-ACP synthase [Liquorilactobacillus mali]|uniref:holo-ACP synthase n=1 Tax=Liquorilactobacillus mali TaxID=1618 RepID=UPI000704A1A7|nr:holo-ACP synthase [Liquorilactobacillus mali]MDN7146003.1 holo-ACP synthase [Liquorilactobacillus mali]